MDDGYFHQLGRSNTQVRILAEVTEILTAIDRDDARSASALLPEIYCELRRLATQKLARERPGQTLQPTALVHEAYIRVVGSQEYDWDNRGHFFAAAAEAMRRILVENARRKQRRRHGGGRIRVDLHESQLAADEPSEMSLSLEDALAKLAAEDPMLADLVKLRFYAGFTMPQVACVLGIPLRTAERYWTYARAWLHSEICQEDATDP